jgi:hypothetical protein
MRQRGEKLILATGRLAQGQLGLPALGGFFDDDADAGHLASGVAHRQRMVQPAALDSGPGGRLADGLLVVEGATRL